MLPPIKLSLVFAALIVIAAPGCCIPGLLCSHSAPSPEVVTSSYSGQYVDSYSSGCSECASCNQAADFGAMPTETHSEYTEYPEYPSQYSGSGQSIMETASPSTGETTNAFQVQEPSIDANSPYVSGSSSKGFQAGNLKDVINPPADLKTPAENALPGNFLP